MTDENQQPAPSQEPDFRAIADEMYRGKSMIATDNKWSAAETMRRLYNSPEALEAMGLCKLDAAELSKHGFFEASKELTLNSEIEAFKRQVDSLEAELKAVREICKTVIADAFYVLQYIDWTDSTKQDFRNKWNKAEAQIASEQKGSESV